MKKILLVFGTRPEAVKMCPLVQELRARREIKSVVCVTGQHREMLDQILATFSVVPDYDLSVMKDSQTLFDVTTGVLEGLKGVLEAEKPDIVLVQGDTTTAFAAALAAYYLRIPVGHVEAGLRTRDIYSPYPEEFNRQAVSIVSRYNFAPTEQAKENLLAEGRDPGTIHVTGNTVIDALKTTVRADYTHPELAWAAGKRLILITAHRRENLGEPMRHMFRAIRRVLDEHDDVRAIYPIHRNPAVRETAAAAWAVPTTSSRPWPTGRASGPSIPKTPSTCAPAWAGCSRTPAAACPCSNASGWAAWIPCAVTPTPTSRPATTSMAATRSVVTAWAC